MEWKGTRQRLVVHSKQVDPAMTGVGYGPYIGDRTFTGIVLPPEPTPDQSRRYLCRLCGVYVPRNVLATIVSVKQLLTIGVAVQVDEDESYWPFELPVTDPLWHFVDGNVSWHLMAVPFGSPAKTSFEDTLYVAPYTYTREGLDAAILARINQPAGVYLPLNGGLPYGEPIAGLGNFGDMRWPWSQQDPSENLGVQVVGPGSIVLYASVYQTDPERRANKPVLVEDAWLRPEDRFVLQNPEARYWRVGGRMVVDFETLPGGKGKKGK